MEDAYGYERSAPAITTIAFFGLKTTVLVPEGSILNVKRITDAAFSLLVYYRSRFQPLFGSKLVVFKPKYVSRGEDAANRRFKLTVRTRATAAGHPHERAAPDTRANEQRLAPASAHR